MDLPKIPILADIPTAALPTPGQGLTLNARGKIPSSVLPSSALLTGRVASGGTINSGTGFTITRNAAGDYVVNFSTALSATPLVLVTVDTNAGASLQIVSANVGTSSFQVNIFSLAGTKTDSFSFFQFLVYKIV